ncbi:MAG: DUF7507 domain-containing protein [Sarcina sp.]
MSLNLRYTTSLKGGMIFTGNTLGLSQDTNLYEPGVQGSMAAFTSLDLTKKVNTFPAGTTLNYLENGSEAQLVLPAGSTVVRAELIWGAIYSYDYISTANPEPPASDNIVGLIDNPVLFNGISINPDPTTGQEYIRVVSGVTTFGWYMRSADVTAIVKSNGGGTYSTKQVPSIITNISNYTARTAHVGWTLAVVYENLAESYKSVYMYVGSEGITAGNLPIDIPIGGFETLPTGPVTSNLYLSAQEGDGDIGGDQAFFGPNTGSLTALSGPVNSVSNFFGGIITDSTGNLDTSGTFGTRNNNTFTNTNTIGSRHGWDINTQNVSSLMTNSQTDAVVRISTAGDAYMVNAIGLTTNSVLTDVTFTKNVNKSIVEVGNELEYSYLIENNGNVDMILLNLIDIVPIETTFIPGSVTINGSPNLAADPNAGISIPDILSGGTATVTFRVLVGSMPNPNRILNTGTLNYEYGGILVPDTIISNQVETFVVQAFKCNTFIYQVVAQENPPGSGVFGNSQFRKINTVTGNVEIVNIDMGSTINAIGYNVLNNFIYGMTEVKNSSGVVIQSNLVQISSDGTVVDLGAIPNITDIVGLNVGAIDNQGFYYLKRASKDYYWTIDLRPSSITYGQLVDPTNGYVLTTNSTQILPSGTLTGGDWTYNIDDGLLYSINDTDTQFITLDPTTGQTNLLPTEAGLPLEYGAMASDGQGFIYGIDNITGDVIRWQNVGGTMQGELFSQTLGTIRNDATMCLNAIIELDFGDAPDIALGTSLNNYRTLLSDNGPRHQIINELFVGQAVTAEVDGLQNPIATGDSDDGLTPPIQIPIAIGNFSVPVDFTNNTGQTANIYAWIDYNQDGIFQTNESFTTTIPSQVGVQTVNLNFVGIPVSLDTDTFMRVRITTETLVNTGGTTAEDTRSFGAALDGEVEDYLVEMFGDAKLTVFKSQSASVVDVGDTITYTIDVTNTGNVDATNSFLTDIVPNGTSYVPGTLTVNSILSGDNLATGVTLPSPIIPNQVVTVKFDIIIDTIPVPNPIVNIADVDYLSNGLPVTGQSNQVMATVNTADLNITKTATPEPVNAGEQIVYTLLIGNAGPNTAKNVNLTDIVSLKISDIEYSLNGGGIWLPWIGSLSLGAIVAFTSITVLIRGNVNSDATGTLVNTANVTSTTADPNLTNNTDTVITPIEQLADMSIIKTGSPDPVIAGEQLIYTLSATNAGPSNADNVNVTDIIPLNGAQYSLNGGITWLLWTGNIALGKFIPGQIINVLIRGIVPQDTVGNINNTATVSSTTADPVPGNNTDTITIKVDTLADISIVKTASPDPVIAGEQLVYTLVVNNGGPSDALNVNIADVMALNNPEFSLDNGLSWNVWSGNINIGTLAAGNSRTVLLRGDVPINITGAIDNTATVTSATPDPDLTNNTDTITTEVDTLADISIIKDTVTNPVIAGAEVIYSFIIDNVGPSNALNANLSDIAPLDNLEYSLDNGTTWNIWGGNLNIGTVVVDTPITVLIRGILPSDITADLVNTATVISTTPDPNLTNNTDTVIDPVELLADLSVIKGIIPSPVVAGNIAIYDLTVTNNGPSDATNVILTDVVPLTTPQYSLNGGITWSAWTGSINLGTIISGNSIIVLIRGTVHANMTGNLINTANVTSATPDPDPTNNTDRITTPINTIADIRITKDVNLDLAIAGEEVIYTLTVENIGPSNALNVTVDDIMQLENPEYSLDGGITWTTWSGSENIGTLTVGSTLILLIRGILSSDFTGSLDNTATVSSTTFDPDLTNNTDTVIIPSDALADLSIIKTGLPDPVIAGEELVYTLIVKNNGPSDAIDVIVDDMPSLDNLEYSLDNGVTWLSPWSGNISVGNLINGESKKILIRGMVLEGTTGSIDNTATVKSSVIDPNEKNNIDTIITQVDTLVDVSIVKTAAPNPVIAGEMIDYTLVVMNSGPSDALNVQVNDALPLKNAQYSIDNGVTWLSWIGILALGTLSVGEIVTILIRGIVPTNIVGNIDNTAVVTTSSPDSNPNNNKDTVRTQVETLADISITKIASPDPVIAGEQLNYTLVVSNLGPSDALSVDLVDATPLKNTQYSINSGVTWLVWPGNINLGTLVAGTNVIVLMRGIVPENTIGSIDNTAVAISITPDPNLNNNTDTVTTQVNTLADVSIVKTASPNPVIAGEELIYTLTVANAGPSDALNVTIDDIPPLNNVEYSLDDGIVWVPWVASVNIGTLLASESSIVLLRGVVPVDTIGSIDNTATVSSTTPDPDPTNNTDTVTTQVDTLADISVVKNVDSLQVVAGEELIYDLTVSNAGPSDALNVVLDDVVPLDSPEHSLNNGLTWLSWGGSINLGTIVSGALVVVLIKGVVPVDTLGDLTNTATVTSTTPDPNLSNNTDTIVNPVDTLADISVIKTATPDPVIAGEELVYNLLVSNSGPSDALSVNLTDNVLLNSAEYSLDDGVTWFIWTGNVDIGTLKVDDSLNVLIKGIVPNDLVDDIINTATVTSKTIDPDTTNNTDRIITVVNELADISIIKTININPVIAGTQAIYTLTVSNIGPSDALDVVVTDTVSLDNPEYSLNDGISWLPWFGSVNIGEVILGISKTILIRGDVPSDETGVLINTASVASITLDPNLDNNTDSIVTSIEQLADLEIIKTTTPFNRTLGDLVVYNLVITNNGPSDALNVTLQDDVPVELLNVEFSLDNGVTWLAWSTPYIIGTLIVGDSVDVLIRGTVSNDVRGIVSNKGVVSSTTPDSNLSNNTSIADIDVLYADLVSPGNFIKAVDKEYADVGEEITYTITVTNTGNVPANNVFITDPIPNDTSYVSNSLTVDGIPNLSNPETGIALASPIAPGETVVIEFRVLVERIPVINPIPNTAFVDYTYTVDSANPDSETVSGETNEVFTRVNHADLIGDNGENFVKAVDKAFTDVNEEITYTINVTNTGNVDANNVIIKDAIPSGTSYVFGSLLVDGVLNASNPEAGINLVTPIAPSQTVIIEFKVFVEEIPVINPIPNKATVDYTYTVDPANPNGVTDSGETNEVFTKVNRADLIGENGENFVKSVDKEFADVGEEITYTVSITNTGNVNANNIVVVDIIPNGTSYVVGSLLVNGALNASNPEMGINLANPIGPNQTVIIEFRVLVEEIPAPNPIPNTAAITYTYTVDPAIPNGVSDGGITNEVLTKVNNATIESEKFVDKEYADVGEEITYTIDITNTGNVPASNVVLTDIIPNGTSYVAGSLTVNGAANSSNPETGIILANPVVPGATTTIIFRVLIEDIPVPNPIPNNATGIFTYTVDPAEPNAQSGEFETNIVKTQVNTADLIGENGENFVKTVDKKYADIGNEITYTVSVTNTGNVDANNVVITDSIPSGTSFVDASLTVGGIPNASNPETGIVLANPIQPGHTVIIVFKVLIEEIPVPNPIPNTAFIEYTYTVDPANLNAVTDSGETNEVLTQVNNADLIGENGENFVKSVDKKYTDTEKTLTYTISVTNTGNVDANNVVITDQIPNDTTYIAGSLRVNGAQNSSNPEIGIVLAKPIAPSATVIIVFKIFVGDIPVPNPISNKALVEYTYTVDPKIPNGASDSGETNEVFTKVNSAELIIVKTSDAVYKDLGDTVLYTIEIFNNGNVSANNVFFTDDLPSELEFAVDSVFIDGVNFVGYDPKVGFNLLGIAPLGTRVVTFEAVVIQAPANLSVENIAVVDYTYVVDPELPEVSNTKMSNADTIIISHGEISEEGLVKAANKEIVVEGDIINYTVDATNSGNVPVDNVVLRDVLPLGVDFIEGTVKIDGVLAPEQDPNVGINLDSIDANQTIRVSFDVKVQENPPTELINTATIDYEYTVDPGEPPVEKVQESNEVIIDVIIPKVILEKSADIEVATIGDIITYTLVATNTGEIDVFDVIVKDLLEPDINFIEGSIKIDGVLFANESILTGINIGTLIIGQAKTITFKAEVVSKTNDSIDNISTGVYKFIVDPKGPARINSFESNLNRIPLEKYELTIEKTANKTVATLNEIITYLVKLTNTGEVEIVNILFKDELPKNLEFVENSFTINGIVVNDVSLAEGVNIGVLNPGEVAFITYEAKVISGSLTGYSTNNAYAQFDYKLSNDVTGSDQTQVVQATVEIPISSFKQMIINTDFCLPLLKPDVEELDDVMADIEIVDSYVVDVMEEISNEGQILTGKKLIVHGYMNIAAKYTALVEDQSMHSGELVIPFSSFIMLPNVYENEKLEISAIIEDIQADLLCPRCIAIGVVLMLRVLIC